MKKINELQMKEIIKGIKNDIIIISSTYKSIDKDTFIQVVNQFSNELLKFTNKIKYEFINTDKNITEELEKTKSTILILDNDKNPYDTDMKEYIKNVKEKCMDNNNILIILSNNIYKITNTNTIACRSDEISIMANASIILSLIEKDNVLEFDII